MTTSGDRAVQSAGDAAVIDPLDVAAIARMANELFAAATGDATGADGESDADGSAAVGAAPEGSPEVPSTTAWVRDVPGPYQPAGAVDITSTALPFAPGTAVFETYALVANPYVADHAGAGAVGDGLPAGPSLAGEVPSESPAVELAFVEAAFPDVAAFAEPVDDPSAGGAAPEAVPAGNPDAAQATGESVQATPDGAAEAPDLGLAPTANGFDAERIKADFPILNERINGRRIVWLDNGATTQKPRQVIDRLSYFYEHENSNVHRTAHTLAGRATDAYEGARDKVRGFINAPLADDIVWVRGTTEGINLIANTFGDANVEAGDEVLITWLEHHANIVPWQMLCARKGATLRVAPVDDSGQIILSEFERLISPRTKLVSFTQVSNALGTITPAKQMIQIAQRHGVTTVVDGAQGVLHMPVDVEDLGCDFYVFSGHKMFAPTGIGVVYGRTDVLADLPPWQGGGNMIDQVYFDHTTYQPPPWRFEAGTGSIADAVALGEAVDYLERIGMTNVEAAEQALLAYGTAGLTTVPGLTLYGTAEHKAGVLSFNLDGHDAEDVGAYLDRCGIAVRAGHHCAQPILRRFGVEQTVRAALALYNTRDDLDRLVSALLRLVAGTPPEVE